MPLCHIKVVAIVTDWNSWYYRIIIYYNIIIIYNNLKRVFVQYRRCLMWQSGKVALWQPKNAHLVRYRRKVIHDGWKLRLRGLEITVRWNWAILCWKSRLSESRAMLAWVLPSVSDFDDFFIKIAPNRWAKFGSKWKMSYLCIVKRSNDKSGMSATRCRWSQRV